ncbi:hypothetical protein ACHAXA_009815 [Cyclostephanos tholiformis]|uniref:DUF676 domain-containing protein n=1 Tax=Cyclostephanos tholiformis TaxID=382380 RepID=A0ABD3R6D5_9STRA
MGQSSSTPSSSSSSSSGRLVDASPSCSSSSHSHHYVPPNTPVGPRVHYIFLIHGWMGNEFEQDYLSGALYRRMCGGGCGGDVDVVVYNPRCNVGRTHDGIRAGGTRLANEIVEYVRTDMRGRLLSIIEGGGGTGDGGGGGGGVLHATYSIVGNSLGGLYARYAISLLPYRLSLSLSPTTDGNHEKERGADESDMDEDARFETATSNSSSIRLYLHPNVFCTTATPHLGVSRHTYLPLPRIVEKIIGTGMRTTGRDLFRLKSASSSLSSSFMRGKSTSRLSTKTDDSGKNGDGGSAMESDGGGGDDGDVVVKSSGKGDDDEYRDDNEDEEMVCVIRNMCLRDKFLSPLRSFRRRIAYANAYGTDFQVPTTTAAFLHERSGVAHHVLVTRGVNNGNVDEVGEGGRLGGGEYDGQGGVPSFIVAVCRTESQHPSSSGTENSFGGGGGGGDVLDDELLLMSQSLDALGWTKVFIDVRDYLPVTGMSTPTWLRSSSGTLDNLIRERMGLNLRSLAVSGDNIMCDNDSGGGGADTTNNRVGCILTSQELARSTNVSDSMDLPLGHAVMVANSKNERYSQLNSAGRPVMDKLAKDIIDDILKFE